VALAAGERPVLVGPVVVDAAAVPPPDAPPPIPDEIPDER
jgi:penicillin-binding protein 2